MNDDLSDEERPEQVRGVLLKALAVLVVIGVLIAVGTTIMVRALGLNDSGSLGPVGSEPEAPLPTTALPAPSPKNGSGDATDNPGDDPSETSSPGKHGQIVLSISPQQANPGDRINLTGTYKGADNVQLEVQRFSDGQWNNFGVQADVNVGTFATYIITSHGGENHFRMYDPQTQKGSNVVLVTIG